MSGQRLCAADELGENEAKGFVGVVEGKQRNIFAVRRDGEIRVYLNSCPHNGVLLDFIPGRFFTLDKRFLQCSTHGAMFRVEDGYCFSGPCTGESLKSLESEVRDGVLFLLE